MSCGIIAVTMVMAAIANAALKRMLGFSQTTPRHRWTRPTICRIRDSSLIVVETQAPGTYLALFGPELVFTRAPQSHNRYIPAHANLDLYAQ